MIQDFNSIRSSIPPSESDILLNKWGYDLLEEYFQMIQYAGLTNEGIVFEFATGSGRMTSLLSRMNLKIITGDLSFENKVEAEKRITHNFLGKVNFMGLDLEHIPFTDNSLKNIICVNTIHHLEDPINCIKELIRVNSVNGKLVLADFNEEGFDVMDKLHKVRYGDIHPRGLNMWDELQNLLYDNYISVRKINTRLNRGFIVEDRKINHGRATFTN